MDIVKLKGCSAANMNLIDVLIEMSNNKRHLRSLSFNIQRVFLRTIILNSISMIVETVL